MYEYFEDFDMRKGEEKEEEEEEEGRMGGGAARSIPISPTRSLHLLFFTPPSPSLLPSPPTSPPSPPLSSYLFFLFFLFFSFLWREGRAS